MTRYDIISTAGRVTALSEGLAALAGRRQALESDWQRDRLAAAERGRRESEPLKVEAEAIDPAAEAEAAAAAERDRRVRRLERISAIAVGLRRQARDALEHRLDRVRAAAEAAARERARQQATVQSSAVLRQLSELLQRAQAAGNEVHRQAVLARLSLPDPVDPPPTEIPAGSDPARAIAGLSEQFAKLEGIAARAVAGWGARLCRLPLRITAHVLLLAPAAGLYAIDPVPTMLPLAGGVLVVTQVALLLVVGWQRGQLAQRLAFLRDSLADVAARAAVIESLTGSRIGAAVTPRIDEVLQAGELSEDQQRQARGAAERSMASIREREGRLRARIERTGARAETAARAAALAAAQERRAAAQRRLDTVKSAAESAILAADRTWEEGCASLSAQAASLAATVGGEVAQAMQACAADHPAWTAPGWVEWTPRAEWPLGLPLAEANIGLSTIAETSGAQSLGLAEAAIRLPVALEPLAAATLVLRASPEGRTAALDLLGQLALRALASAPAGRLKLVLADPVGLGQSFAPLLSLADHGDAVLAGGVATEPERIDRALEDLCAHVEAVVRTRLRGRYETIAEYNREAGELQEPVRLVVLADFPAGFGERSLERLSALLRSGARCGVHVLVHHDVRQRLAPAIDVALTQHAALVLREKDGALTCEQPDLRGWTLTPLAMPPPAQAARLATAAGAAAVKANRVELAFASVVPPPAGLWSESSAERLRVPIGLCGVGKVQHLELGRGTAQHVLIGGRTGSGKSTLLHVMVTSAALWYHPRELEFHLIDFKKGVEFQAYAATKLPHARVVAVESDREFGLSVLRRLDGELARRGDLFRAAGAQDLAAHRRSGGEHLPRILLLIDEFQEFFTEDDTVARDAALLLDRFVRQGRAFGLHVVLGSQTLSGSYSLAKSSLGQMGVRIVLPCNEADGHLLLHEDNDAVRLLTRPGEAIYNDQAGLADGNSPFQVCWLSDSERSGHLRPLAARAEGDGWKASSPTVIFAGDAPARFDEDAGLAALLARVPTDADRSTAAWVGQSSSLRGAAEAVFPAASGGNLLLCGQHREAAHGIIAALAICLAARHLPGGLEVCALDGEEAEGPFAALWERLAATLPTPAPRFGGREAAACLDRVMGVLDRRTAGEDPARTPVLVAVNAMQRLRALRPDDDVAFDRPAGEPLPERFARLLAQGPEVGVHVAVWCDSLSGVQRSFSRRSLRDFDLRILFQMSPADSNELIDDDAASRLGLHSALLAVLGEGRREKFRPWQVPDKAFLDRIGVALRARGG